MPDYSTSWRTEVDSAIENFGELCRIRYFTEAFTDANYDEATLTISGTDYWISGFPQPLSLSATRGGRSSTEAQLLEQGDLLSSDTKLYLAGSINVSGTMRIGIGSRASNMEEYSVLQEGVDSFNSLKLSTPLIAFPVSCILKVC